MTGRRVLEEAKPFVKWAGGKRQLPDKTVEKKKLVMILTEEGLLDAKVVEAHSSTEDIELKLSEIYSLNSIQWMEIRAISNQTREVLGKAFGISP